MKDTSPTPDPNSTPNDRPLTSAENLPGKQPKRRLNDTPKRRGPKIQVLPKHRRIARSYVRDGKPLQEALADNGYSPKSGRYGLKKLWKNVPAIKLAMEAELQEWSKAKRSGLTPEDDAELVKFRLRLNTLRGEDRGTLSAKTLGSLKEVGMFDESKSGISLHLNVANVPLEWRSRYSLQTTEDAPIIATPDMPKGT